MRLAFVVVALAVVASEGDSRGEPALAPTTPPVKTSAANDHPHLLARLAPLLARMTTCVPRADLRGADDDEPIEIAPEVDGDRVVACASTLTARGGSAYLDDGAARVDFDGRAHELAITTRAGALVRMFASPPEMDHRGVLRGQLVYVGHTIFMDAVETTAVLDDQGKRLATLHGANIHVLDGGHALVFDEHGAPSRFDLATNTATPFESPGHYIRTAVQLGDAVYAIDDDTRLVILDAKTFAVRSKRPLRVCPKL